MCWCVALLESGRVERLLVLLYVLCGKDESRQKCKHPFELFKQRGENYSVSTSTMVSSLSRQLLLKCQIIIFPTASIFQVQALPPYDHSLRFY